MIPCYGTHGSKPGDIILNSLVLCLHAGQRINKSIQEEHKIWVLAAEAYRGMYLSSDYIKVQRKENSLPPLLNGD